MMKRKLQKKFSIVEIFLNSKANEEINGNFLFTRNQGDFTLLNHSIRFQNLNQNKFHILN